MNSQNNWVVIQSVSSAVIHKLRVYEGLRNLRLNYSFILYITWNNVYLSISFVRLRMFYNPENITEMYTYHKIPILHLEKNLYCSAIHNFLFRLYISYIRAFTVYVYMHKLLTFLVLCVCERLSYISIFQVKQMTV